MSEDTGARPPLTERVLAKIEKPEAPPVPIPEAIRPSRAELTPFIPKPEYYIEAGLPHHGVLHGEETVILAGVLLNAAHADIESRRGKELADQVMGKVDRDALLTACAYHDCGRITDWQLHKGEMQKHGPRGGKFLAGKYLDGELLLNPHLTDEQVQLMTDLVSRHTPTKQETRARIRDFLLGKFGLSTKAGRERKTARSRNFEDYEPNELMLRILQEADKLGLSRGYYSRTVESPDRTIFATAISVGRVAKTHMPFIRARANFENNPRFSVTRNLKLYAFANALTRMSRRDPEINRMFANVPSRSGAAMESAQRLGMLKS